MLGTTPITSTEAKNQFLLLLTTQLRYQNPLEPVDNTEFVAQLAQLSSLEQLENLNGRFEQLLQLQQLSEGATLIGRGVTYADATHGLEGEGVVQAISVGPQGYHLLVDGQLIPIGAITGLY